MPASACARRVSMNRITRTGAHAAGRSRTGPRHAVKRSRPARRQLSPREKRKRSLFLIGTVAAVLLLAVLAALQIRYTRTDLYAENMAQAEESRRAGDYDSALRALRKAAAERETEECLLLMADCYEQQGNLDKALELLRGMDLTHEAVSGRIARIDQQRTALNDAQGVAVLGVRMSETTTALVLDDRNLQDSDLEEICQLYALDNLSLMDNRLQDISALARLGGLDILNLSGNRISDVSALAELSELRSLYLDGNPIADLSPLYGLKNLNMLSLRDVAITRDQLTELSQALPACAIYSDLEQGEVGDISLGGVTFRSDVSQLDLSNREIRDISALSACKQLRWLKLGGNQISDLQALMNIPGLELVDLSNNELSDLRPLMGLSRLRSLNAAGNQLTDTAALGTMTALTALDLSDNPLTDFSGLEKLSNLQSLKLKNTGIVDMDLQYLEGLNMLRGLALEENEGLSNEAVSYLKSMIPSCTIIHSDLVYSAQIGDKTYPSNLTELNLSGQNLTDLGEIDKLDSLETLNLSQNQLTSVFRLEYCPSRLTLRELNLSYNEIEDISALGALSAVEVIDLTSNNISSIQSLQRLKGLRVLKVGGNPLTKEQLDAFREALPDCELITDW